MSTAISVTLPDIVVEALNRKGKPFDHSASDVVKIRIMMAAHGSDVPFAIGDLVKQIEAEGPTLNTLQQADFALGGGQTIKA